MNEHKKTKLAAKSIIKLPSDSTARVSRKKTRKILFQYRGMLTNIIFADLLVEVSIYFFIEAAEVVF